MMVEENRDPFLNPELSTGDSAPGDRLPGDSRPEPELGSGPDVDLSSIDPLTAGSVETSPQNLDSDPLSAPQTQPAKPQSEGSGLFARIGKLFQGIGRQKPDPMILPVPPINPTLPDEPANRLAPQNNEAEATQLPDSFEDHDLSGRFEMVNSAEEIPFARPIISSASADNIGDSIPAEEPEQNPFTVFQGDEPSVETGVTWINEPISGEEAIAFDQPIETFGETESAGQTNADVSAFDPNSLWPAPFSTTGETEPTSSGTDDEVLNQRLAQDGFNIPPQDMDWAARRHMTWDEMHGTSLGEEILGDGKETLSQPEEVVAPGQSLNPEETHPENINPEDINPLEDYSAWSAGPETMTPPEGPDGQRSAGGVFSSNQNKDELYEALFDARDTLSGESTTGQPEGVGQDSARAGPPPMPPTDPSPIEGDDFFDRIADFTDDNSTGRFQAGTDMPAASPQTPEHPAVFEFSDDRVTGSGEAFINDGDLEDAILDRLNQAVEPVDTSRIVSPRPVFTPSETESPFQMDESGAESPVDGRVFSGVEAGDQNPLVGYEEFGGSATSVETLPGNEPGTPDDSDVDPWENRTAARIQSPWSMPDFTREPYGRPGESNQGGSGAQRAGRSVTTYSPVRPASGGQAPAGTLATPRRQPKAGETEIKPKPSLKPVFDDVQEWAKQIDRKKALKIGGLVLLGLLILAGLIAGALWAIQALARPTGPTIEAPIVDPGLRTYPIGVRLTGGWMIYLQRGTLTDGKWDPQGSEWLETTEIRRVVAIPWSKQLDAVVQTLSKGDEIELFMSNNDIVKYKVDGVSKMPRSKTDILNSKQRSLVVILYQKDDSDRWVVICKP
jgi:hypothetical protein